MPIAPLPDPTPNRPSYWPARGLPLVWIAGVWFCLLIAFRQHWRWSRLIRRQAPLQDARVRPLLNRATAELGVRRSIPVIPIPSHTAPAVFGFWRPCLLLPVGLSEKLTDAELRLVLLHELVHLKRGDVLLNWLLIGVQALHWFNPLVWLALRQLRADRELVCDAAVLQRLPAETSSTYGHTLLKVAAGVTANSYSPNLVPILQRQRQPQLERRILMITHRQPVTRLSTLTAIFLVTLLGCLTFTAAEKHDTTGESPRQETAPSDPIQRPTDKATGSHRDVEALQQELDKMNARVAAQQERVDRLRKQLGITSEEAEAPGKSLFPELMLSLKQEQVSASAEWTELHTLYDLLSKMPSPELRNAMVTATADTLLANLLEQRMQAERQRVDLAHVKSSEHPDVVRAQDNIATINRQIDERVKGIMNGLKAKVDAKKAKLDSLQKELEQAKAQDIRQSIERQGFFTIKRDLESLQRIRESLMIRIIQAEVNAAMPRSSTARASGDKFYSVGGPGIAAPGRLVWRPGTTLQEALAEAGGLTAFSHRAAIQLLRNGKLSRTIDFTAIQRGNAADIELQANDRIFVPAKEK